MKQKLFTLLTLALFFCSGAWAADGSQVPQGLKNVTSNTTIYYADIVADGSTTKWYFCPSFSTETQTYTNITSTTDNGNPHGITDNISTSSSASMSKVSTNGNTFTSAKKVIHLHVKGIEKVIAHGRAGSSGRGLQISATEYVSGSTDTMDESTHHVSFTRKSNSGSVLGQLTGLDASKEYIVSIYGAGGDCYFYCAELIAGVSCTDVAAPTDLACSAQTSTSLTYTWTAAEHASKYTASLYTDAECATTPVATIENIATTSVTFSTLNASTTYYCKVQSNGDGSTYCAEGGVTATGVSGTTGAKAYTVTAASNNDEWGTAAAAAGSLDASETTEITATANPGYKFESWAVSGEGASLSSTTDNPTTLTIGSADATVTATFRELYHYTITYNKGAYGEGDAIANGDKTEDADFTLSSSKYTRDGYVQTGWALTDGGSKAYNIGGTYTENENLALYPVWTAPYTQRTVSGIEVWDWADATGSDVNLSNTTTPAKDADADIVAANFDGNIYEYDCGFPDNFDALVFYKFQRPKNGTYYQGQTIKIKTSVPGIVTVKFANTGNKRPNRYLQVNGTIYGEGSGDEATASQRTVSVPVAAGDITLTGIYEPTEANYKGAGKDKYQEYVAGNAGTAQYLNYYKVEFAPTVTVSVGGKGYATYCNSDCALDFTDCTIQPYVIASTDGSTLTLTNKKKVAKNEPVLLYSSTNSDSKSVPAIADGDATADATNKLVKGDNLAHTWVSGTAEHYVLATATVDPGFYRANNNTVASTKAYLDLTGLSGAHSFTLDLGDGDVTGINTVQGSELKVNGYYDLQGRKIAQPTKGLYIVNGKKVVIK